MNKHVMGSFVFITLLVFLLGGCGPTERQFYPIGLYTVATEEAFDDAKRAGFNSVVVYEHDPETVIEAERLAADLGLKLVCYPGFQMWHKGNIDKTRVETTLGKLRDSETMLAWYLFDEPEAYDLRADLLHNFHLYVKKLSPSVPTAFVVGNGEKFRTYAGCSDIAMVDWYPIPLYPLDSVAHHIDACGDYTAKDQPIWMVIQAFDWTPFSKKVREQGTGRVPNLNEIRYMTFLSVVEKVDGLFFWSYRTLDDKWVILDHPQLWSNLCQVIKDLNKFYAFVISTNVVETKRESEDTLDEDDNLCCILKSVSRSDLIASKSEMMPGRYLLAVNGPAAKSELVFADYGSESVVAEELFSGKTIRPVKGGLRDELLPLEVKLYYLGK